MNIAVVIPMYNEEKTIGSIIQKAKVFGKVIAIDDGSQDNSFREAKKNGAAVVRHAINMGVGFSTKTGVEKALRENADIIITMDADGQHDPNEIPRLITILQNNKLDVVIGSRFSDNMPLNKKFGNWWIYKWSKFLFGVDIIDTQSGFRAFTKNAYKKLQWDSRRYAICSEIVMKIGKNKLKFKEIPVKSTYIDKFKGTTVLDGIRIWLSMLLWKMREQ